MSLIKKAKSVVKSVKKAFTTPSKRAEEARKQYETARGEGSRIVESVKNWATSSAKPNQNTVRPSYSVSSYKNTPKDVKAFYNQQNKDLKTGFKTLKTDAKEAWRKGGIEQRRAVNKGQTYTGGQFSYVSQNARETFNNAYGLDVNGELSYKDKGRMNALRDTARSYAAEEAYNRYSVNNREHHYHVGRGEAWIKEPDIVHWLGLDKDAFTEEDIADYESKYEAFENYYRNYIKKETIYNSETGRFEKYEHIADNAPLPPWIAPTPVNQQSWDYYTSYESEVGTALHNSAIQTKLEQAAYRKHPYKSAFSGEEGAVNSAAEVLYASSSPQDFWRNYKTYIKDYHINPLLAGEFGTLMGNHLWNLMDSMDFASRGTRAFIAGDSVLGGTGFETQVEHTKLKNTGYSFLGDYKHTNRLGKVTDVKTSVVNDVSFKGQNVVWAKVNGYKPEQVQEAQKIFMRNGGYDLILRNHPELASKRDFKNTSKLSDEEIINNITVQLHGDRELAEGIYNYLDNYLSDKSPFEDVKQGFVNVKKAYTDPAETFEADTGSVVGNIFLESVLDPGLIVGGPAKGAAQTGAKKLATESIENVLTLFKYTTPEVLDSKAVRNAINAFSQSNEGRSILFKNADKLKSDAEGLATVLVSNGAIQHSDRKAFSKALTNALTGTQYKVNGKVIGSQFFDELDKTRKLYKTAAFVDRGIDAIDTAIIKGSFIEPLVLAKLTKQVNLSARQMRIVRGFMDEAGLKNSEAARTLISAMRKGGAVGSLEELAVKRSNNMISMEAYAEKTNVIKRQFKTANQMLEHAYNELANGSITSENAFERVNKIIDTLTGREGSSIDDLISAASDSIVKGELDDAIHGFNRIYTSFIELAQDIENTARKQFLNEIRHISTEDELAELVLKYSDRINIHDFRLHILDNIPGGVIKSEVDLDNILNSLSSGLLAERSVSFRDIKKARDAISNPSTKVHGRYSTRVEIDEFLDCIDTVYKDRGKFGSALKDAIQNDEPFVSKITKVLNSFHTVAAGSANDNLIKAIDSTCVSLAEQKAMGAVDPVAKANWENSYNSQLLDELQIFKGMLGDTTNLSGVDSISVFHLDKQAKFDTIINDRSFSILFDKVFDESIAPAVDILFSKSVKNTDAYEKVPVYQALMRMSELRYSYDRYRRFIYDLDRMDISDEAKYAIRNGLFGCYGESGSRLIDVTRKPGAARTYIESTLYNEFGASRVGMESLTAKLRTIDNLTPDSLIADYVDQINSSSTLREWYDDIINGDPADSETYLKTQILSAILMDPTIIERFNSYNEPPIFLHISTTGFGDQASITGISYKKWPHIEPPVNGDKLDLLAIKEAFDNTEKYNIKRVMDSEELSKVTKDDSFLYSIYNNSVGTRFSRPEKLRERYKSMFGVSEEHPVVNSEADILEDFFNHIYSSTYSEKSKNTIIPKFVVHDLEGFNIPYINRRASLYTDLDNAKRTVDYLQRIAPRAEECAINTFDDMRRQVNDAMLSADEFDKVEKYINALAQDFSENTSGAFNMLDIMDFPNEIRTVLDTINGYNSVDVDDEIMQTLMQNLDPEAVDQMLKDAYEAMTDIAALEDEAKQISALSGMDRPRPLSGVHYNESELEEHFGEEITSALSRISDQLGINLIFKADEEGALGTQQAALGALKGSVIVLNTNWKSNLKETFMHELRHDLSRTSDFGERFNNIVLDRMANAEGSDIKLADTYIDWKVAQYPQFDNPALFDLMNDEVVTPVFQYYMSSPDVISDVQNLLMERGLLATEEGVQALEILKDLKTIFSGSFELDTYANARHFGAPLDAEGYEIVALEKCLIKKFCSEGEVKNEFLNSLINAVLDKDRLKNDILQAVVSQNPVKNASNAVGERVINVADKYHLNSIRKYFSGIGSFEEGITISYENIKHMSDISKWIDNKIKYSVRLGAEDFLESYKPFLDKIINAVRDLAIVTASQNMLGFADSFAYLQYLDTPASATDSYLLCQKLYDDLLKYWLNKDLAAEYAGELVAINSGDLSHVSDEFRSILLAQFVNGLDFYNLALTTGEDVLRLLEGDYASNIFKDVPLAPSTVTKYTAHGKVKEGITAARRLKKAYQEMKAVVKDHEYLDAVLRASGIHKKFDYKLGFMYSHAADLDESLTNYIVSMAVTGGPSPDDMFEAISDAYCLKLHSARFNRLLKDGVVDEDKLISELLWNNAFHIAFQRDYFSNEELKLIKDCVDRLNKSGHDYIKIAEDRNTVAVYLSDDCKVFSNKANNRDVRYIYQKSNSTYGTYYTKPEFEHIALPDFDEFKTYHLNNTGEYIDAFEDVYVRLKQCWDDVPLLSDDASLGTSGLVVFSRDAEEYYKTARQLMPDMLSNEGFRRSEMCGNVIYDPGFMSQGNFDILTEYYKTLGVESNNIRTSGALINNVFGIGNEYSFEALAEQFSDEELAGLFNDNVQFDFVVCALVPAKDTKTGLQVKQLKLHTAADVARARKLNNTAVLPYDMYIEIAEAINSVAHPTELNIAINKLMLIYKASSLFHPGTWVRNFIDATQKSATDLNESPLNVFNVFGYELSAIEDIQAYDQITKWSADFIDETNWDTIASLYHSKMTYEDFELLSGVMESNRYITQNKKLLEKAAKKQGGRVQISGSTVGLRDLPKKDISAAYDATAANVKNYELPLTRKEFLSIYTGERTARTQKELDDYERVFRDISYYLQTTNAIDDVNNLISASFIPFNYAETIVRYAQLKQLGQLGYSNNQALKHVHATQFRSSVRHGIPNKLEYVLPFITFKYNNLKYWLRMMDENPRYFRYFEKLYGNVYEDSFENQADTGVQLDFNSSHMLKTGGIPIGTGEYYFKLNPSFFDTLSLMYNLPVDSISSLNPLLKVAARYSMYQMGLDSKYFLQDLDLSKKDVDPYFIITSIAPRISSLRDAAYMLSSGGVTWSSGEPTIETFYKLIPSLIGKNSADYIRGDFEDYQNALAKQGKWYDCNVGGVVPLSRKNEYGANDPGISWMDRQNYMMLHHNELWDANLNKFVKAWDVSQGGLNDFYDFSKDPDAWDELCKLYATKGMRFDYNIKKFVPFAQVTSGGLNSSNLDFPTYSKLMEDKFNLIWDANQNAFVEPSRYMVGGLNNIKSINSYDDFKEVMLYRYALFGETYDRNTHKFSKTDTSKVVVASSKYQLKDYDNYFAMLGIPRLPVALKNVHINSAGLLVDKDGKYVLTSNNEYNQRVFDQLRKDYGGLFTNRGRRYNGFKNYSYSVTRKSNKKYSGGINSYDPYQTGIGWNEEYGYYRLEYSKAYQYSGVHPDTNTRYLITPHVHYPYGGGYGKFAFYSGH